MAVETEALLFSDVTRRFGANTALDRISFAARKGEVFGLLGPNGAGKTTAVRLSNGVLLPSTGEIKVLGMGVREHADEIREKSGVLTEAAASYERLSAIENLWFFARAHGISDQEARVRGMRMLEKFGLADRARARVAGFSTGMKKRLALARALLHDPEIVFLDEPTSGLDPEAAKNVLDLIAELSSAEGRTIILSTHNLHEAEQLCHRVAIVFRGRVLAIGTPGELADSLAEEVSVRLVVENEAAAPGVAESLGRLPFQRGVSREGAILTVAVDTARKVADVVAAAVAAGGRLVEVTRQGHTLEAAYLRLVEKARNRGGKGEGVA